MAEAELPASLATGATPDISTSSLYQEIILAHYRAPRHRRVLAGAATATDHSNPLCGDVVAIQIQREGGRVLDAGFTARACSITQATASMVLDRIIGGTVADARTLLRQIDALIEGKPLGDVVDADHLGDLMSLASVARFPARKACVRLVTTALADALGTE